jgi:hypothetical protein
VKAKQRSRDRDIKEGDRNRTYFHSVANHRRRNMLVHSLDGPDGPITDEAGMLDLATSFYKNPFKKEVPSRYRIADNFFSTDERVSENQNRSLEAPFTEEEVKKAIFYSYSDGAPSPDGLPFIFYQHFWDMLKDDLMAMFKDFHDGNLDIYRLNFAILTLIPK